MRRLTFLSITTVAGAAFAQDPVISAHLVGWNYGSVDTNIVVTAEKQKAFHFHSDVEGGGTWYDAFISLQGQQVTVIERDSVSAPYKSGSKVTTHETIYSLPADKIVEDSIELRNGNRITCKTSKREHPTTSSPLRPEEVVNALLRAAHDNNLQGVLDSADMVKIAALPRHGRSPKAFIAFLKGIDPSKVTLQTRPAAADSTVVRMTAPVSMDFEVAREKAGPDGKEGHYIVVGVHP